MFMNLSINTKAYLEPCQVSMMEFFGGNSQRLPLKNRTKLNKPEASTPTETSEHLLFSGVMGCRNCRFF